MNYRIKANDDKAGYFLRVARSGNHLLGICAICRNPKDEIVGHRTFNQLDFVFDHMKKGNYYIEDEIKKIVSAYEKDTSLTVFTFLDDFCHKYTVGADIDFTVISDQKVTPMNNLTLYKNDDIKCIRSSGTWKKDDILMMTSKHDQILKDEIQEWLYSTHYNLTKLPIFDKNVKDNTIVLYTRKE